jgi:hypothetical protein
MASVVFRVADFRRRAERIGYALGGALVVAGEADAHMAVVKDRVALTIGLLDLVQRLRYQERLQSVTGHEGQGALEEIQPAQRREFVEHEQQAVPLALRVQIFGQAPPDLIEDQPDQWLGPANPTGSSPGSAGEAAEV